MLKRPQVQAAKRNEFLTVELAHSKTRESGPSRGRSFFRLSCRMSVVVARRKDKLASLCWCT